jgi:hypothetical protein
MLCRLIKPVFENGIELCGGSFVCFVGIMDDPDIPGKQIIHFGGNLRYSPTKGIVGSFCAVNCDSRQRHVNLMGYSEVELVMRSQLQDIDIAFVMKNEILVDNIVFQAYVHLPAHEWKTVRIPFGDMM